MGKAKPKLTQVLIPVAFAFSCFGLLLFLWSSFGGPVPFTPEGYRIKVPFKEATQLAVESDVRISNVSVGKVKAIDLNTGDDSSGETGTATATIEIDSQYAPLPADSRAMLRQKTLLGETYVELTPGTRGEGDLAEGATLPPAQVAESVQLDEIFRSLDERTRLAFRVWMQGSAAATEGNGYGISTALGTLEPFTADANRLVQILATQDAAVSGLLRNGGEVFQALSERRGQLRGFIENADTVFTTTGNRNQDLRDLFVALPTFLRESRLTLRKLDDFSSTAQPVVNSMLPASKQLSGTFEELAKLSPQAEGFFVGLKQVEDNSTAGIPALQTMVDPTSTASQGGFKPVLAQSTPFTRQVTPILNGLSDYRREFASALGNVAAATNAYLVSPGTTRIVKVLRTSTTLNPSSLTASASGVGRFDYSRTNPYVAAVESGPPPLASGALAGFETRQCTTGPSATLTNSGPNAFTALQFSRITQFAFGNVLNTNSTPTPGCVQQGDFASIGFPSENTQYQHVWALP